jgi:hypothetical protein
MPSRNRIQLKGYVRFQLSQLSARNGHHEFENLAFEIARVRVVPNLLPATGPVQAGGDQGRDFESYRTYLAGSSLGTSAFVTTASDNIVVGACSLQKNIAEKIKDDLKTIFSSGTRPDHVAYFCEVDVPVAKRHELQRFCQETFAASLEIFDGQALADLLAERDTFWIAEQFLSIPAEEWPAESTNEQYRALRDRWVSQSEEPANYADFLDIKQGLRTASFDESAKPDLSSWLKLMRNFVSGDIPERLIQKARYEIAVAELRGRGSLDPASTYVEEYFSKLSGQSSAAELLDGAVLAVYARGAVGHRQTSITQVVARGWKRHVETVIETALSDVSRKTDRCMLLDARAMSNSIAFDESLNSEVWSNRFFDLWGDVVTQIKTTPYYPIKHVADILEQVTPLIGTHPRFRAIADDVDTLVSERAGNGAAADRARRRALAHLKVDQYVAALNELQKAKVGWFSGETIGGSILSMLIISDTLSRLGLHFAARYYAAGALFILFRQQNEELKRHIAPAFFRLADTFHSAGEGISYTYILANALDAHHAFGSDPHDWTKHPAVQTSFAQAATLRAIALRLDRSIIPLIDKAMSTWPLPEEEIKAFTKMSEGPPWADMLPEEIETRIADELGQHPFSDIGPRSATWSALGIVWTVKCNIPTLECWIAVTEVAAILQLAQVEFGDADLVVVPSEATIEVELRDTHEPQIEQLPDNGKLAWRLIMPSEYKSSDNYNDVEAKLAAMALTILGQTSALPFETFQSLTEERFERGLAARFFSVRPIRELLASVQPEKLPFALLANTTRRKLSISCNPIVSAELQWRSSPGPGYSKERAEEYLRNRYERGREAFKITLPRIIRDDRCRSIIEGLRKEGLLDWQILGLIGSMVAQYQVQKAFPDRDPRTLGKEITDRIYRAECVNDPQFDLKVFSTETVAVQKKIVSVAALKTWGLEIHRQTPDFTATKKLLDVRFGNSTDDLPHDDPFLLEN